MMKKISSITLLIGTTAAFALQGGPTQPDYAQFEPSGMTDMVSLQSGDFSYQIPLSDIPSPYGNYPLSLSYHAGISPQQEASWVGLGWSLNPGSINRDVRGVPDDQFHGGTLGFIYQYSVTQVWSVNLGYSNGVFSVGQTFSSDGSVGFSATIGPELSGIAGVGFTVGTDAIGVTARAGLGDNAKLNAGMMFSTKDGKPNVYAGASLTIAGASLGAQVSTGSGVSARVGFGDSDNSVGLTVSSNGVSASATSGETTVGLSRSGGATVSVGESTTTIANSQTKGSNKSSTAGFAVVVPTNIGVFSFGFSQTTFEYWMRSATSEYLYGYIYQAGPSIDVSKKNEVDGAPDAQIAFSTAKGQSLPWDWTMKGRTLESMGNGDQHPAYDMYSVSSEGASGSFRPFARETHQMYKWISNKNTKEQESVETYNAIMKDCADSICADEFVYVKDAQGNRVSLVKTNPNDMYLDYQKCPLENDTCSIYAYYETNYRNRGNRLLFNSKENEFEDRGGIRFLFAGEGNGYYESDDVGEGKKRPVKEVSNRLIKKLIDTTEYALYGSKRVEPIFEDDSPMGKLAGFVVTTADGVKYRFTKPVRSFLKVDYSINQSKGVPVFIDKSTDAGENFWNNLWEGVKSVGKWVWKHLNPLESVTDVYDFFFKAGTLEEKCTTDKDSKSDDYFYSYTINMNPHATQWLITEIQGADYVAFDHDTIGYNVKFKYTEPSIYRWRTPYSRPGIDPTELPNFKAPRDGLTPEGCDSKMYQASFGVKEYIYLKSIETATHRVDFELNQEERVDGKGWGSSNSLIPIMVQASVGFDVSIVSNNTKQTMTIDPQWIYLNTPLPKSLLKEAKNKYINVHGLTIVDKEVEKLKIVDDSLYRTTGTESQYGLYKVKISQQKPQEYVFVSNGFPTDLNAQAINLMNKKIIEKKQSLIVYGEYADFKQHPYIDWSEFVFAGAADIESSSSFDNQMRYLTKINYYRKIGSDTVKYKEYDFNYDYSLQPKTLNSYCRGRYPEADSVDQIVRSPDSVGLDICKTDTTSKSLYGKLTLRSITEKGCQNGKCATLPPFVFSYNSPTATPTRISKKDGWIDMYQGSVSFIDDDGNVGADDKDQFPKEYFEDFKDVDATILASANTTDEYGFWSNMANVENHKVDQSFADFGAAAWSLNKVVDPTGGNLEVEYERDNYLNGEDFAKEVQTIEFADFGKCGSFKENGVSSKYSDNLCFKIKPLYWREQCLGPRAAHWDTLFPVGFYGNKYAYLDSMGVKVKSHVFFNMLADVKTKVKCGLFGWGRCSRTRSVALMGDASVEEISGNNTDSQRLIAFDRLYSDVEAYIIRAGKRINDNQNWTVSDGYGYLWTIADAKKMKAGDLRVTKLTRHDFNLKSQTTYDYGEGGEIAQLADSAFTTVLGNRFFGSKLSYSIPDVKLNPISRIVGFNDEDLMYLPGPKITYPKVSVTNSSEGGAVSNGTTEFSYITPETGVPVEYVDDSTKKVLKPFFKINIRNIHAYEYSNTEKKKMKIGDYNDGHVFKVDLLDANQNLVYENNGTQNPVPLSRTLLMFRDELSSLSFYSENIKNVRYVRIWSLGASGQFNAEPTVFSLENEAHVKFEDNSDMTKTNVWSDFNEIMFAVISKSPYAKNHISFAWFRSQKPGYYPIVYKKIDYTSRSVDLSQMVYKGGYFYAVDTPKYSYSSNFNLDFETNITYHDLSAFLGQNYKTVFKRGSGEKAIVIKKDSSLYSTAVPNIVGYEDSVKYKIGRQKEKWSSEQKLQCYEGKNLKKKGKDDICMKQYMRMYLIPDGKTNKNFTYIRYPAFQLGSVSYTGYDNQTASVDENKLGKTELHNFDYDPLTGSPTATLATVSLGQSKVLRKLTKMYPYYALKGSGMADSMFLRNMLTQKYMDEIYTDTLKDVSVADLAKLPLTDTVLKKGVDVLGNLRSFSITPYRFIPKTVFGTKIDGKRKPIVAWGTYTTKGDPQVLKATSNDYVDNVDSLPSLIDYSGTEIVAIDTNLKVTETKDVLNRSLTTVFSKDGMYQLSLFYPAKREEVGAIIPYQGAVHNTKNCTSLDNPVKDGSILMSDYDRTLGCTVAATSGNLIKEYRIWNRSNGWMTERQTVTVSTTGSVTVTLPVPANSKLNYFRVYPEKAESKSFIYDNYGNMIQSVAEDNTSTYYEYDPLGNLVQSRNDDGVSFKAHHREYMNDTTTQKVMGE